MADSVDAGHGTSDEYLDPHCEPCFDSKRRSINVYGYCHECYQFMCPDCHVYHGKFPLAKNHVILRGSKMPKSFADKPPKYERCDDHPKQWKEKFCCGHKELVCSTCSDSSHKTCLIKCVDDVCKMIPSSELDVLCDTVKNLNDQANSVKAAVETSIGDCEDKRKQLMKETQNVHEKIISKVNKLFQGIQSEIAAEYQSQNAHMTENKETICDIITRTEEFLGEANRLKGKPIDTKLFLKIQEYVKDINKISDDFRNLTESRKLVSLTFDQSTLLLEIMADSATFGSVKNVESKPDLIEVNDVKFPQYIPLSVQTTQVAAVPKANQQVQKPVTVSYKPSATFQQISSRPSHESDQLTVSNQSAANTAGSRSTAAPVPLSEIKATKQNSYQIQLKDDAVYCWITGMALTKDNRRLLADIKNNKVKLFSQDMKFLSSVQAVDIPRDIAVVSDQTAVVTTRNKKLVMLDISGRQLSIIRTVQLNYNIYGISSCKDKLVVTCPDTEPPSVKLIDQTGRVYWSVSTDQQGRQLFVKPMYVCCHDDGRTSTVVVTDRKKNTLTLLNAETGEVVTTRQLKGDKGPHGVTTDTAGNVYVCYTRAGEVSVLTGDLADERILLTRQDDLLHFPFNPSVIVVYDETRNQLIVSYWSSIDRNNIDCFQLS